MFKSSERVFVVFLISRLLSFNFGTSSLFPDLNNSPISFEMVLTSASKASYSVCINFLFSSKETISLTKSSALKFLFFRFLITSSLLLIMYDVLNILLEF